MGKLIYEPEIVGTTYGKAPLMSSTRIYLHPSDTHAIGLCPGSWTVASTNGQIGVVTNGAAADYVIVTLYDKWMNKLDYQYLTTTQLNDDTNGGYYADAMPIGNIVFRMQEDANTTPITNATSGSTTAYYAECIVTEPAEANSYNIQGRRIANIQIDSSSASSSAGTTLVTLLGPDPCIDNNPYSATTLASPRLFRAKIRSAGFSQ